MNRSRITRLFILAIVVFAIGIISNYYASIYAIEKASNSVSDIILSNIPTFDVDLVFVLGPIIFWVFVASILFCRPNRIPFTIEAVGLILVTRAIFVTLTHIGPFPGHAPIDYNYLGFFTTGGDLFFSGHTALPFMVALVFWRNVRLRVIFIGSSVFFGVVVLLGHLHYSIDVAAAFFITYTVYHLATILFKRSRAVFYEGFEVLS